MKLTMKKQILLLLSVVLFSTLRLDAQTYVRYVTQEDLHSKVVYADSVLTSIQLPRGLSQLSNYPKFNAAAYELSQVLKDPKKKLLQVWVCGSASPDGLWAYNVKLSQARTDSDAEYLQEVMNIPSEMIHKESLNKDWRSWSRSQIFRAVTRFLKSLRTRHGAKERSLSRSFRTARCGIFL